MTCIVFIATKKLLKEHVEEKGDIHIEDPSIFDPFRGSAREYLKSGKLLTVTNHPKRSWFAQITLDKNDKLIVK